MVDGFPGAKVGLVEGRVDLAPAFDKIEGSYGCVGWSASWRMLDWFRRSSEAAIPMIPPNPHAAKYLPL